MKNGDRVTVLTAADGFPSKIGYLRDKAKGYVSISKNGNPVIYHFRPDCIRPVRTGDLELVELNERMERRARRLREIADILEDPHGRADMVEDVISSLNQLVSEISKEFN